jgi:hypothetical protein
VIFIALVTKGKCANKGEDPQENEETIYWKKYDKLTS